MIKTLLVTSGLALTTLFSHAATSHSNAAPTSINTQQPTKWQIVKSEFTNDKKQDVTKQNQHGKLLKLVEKYTPDQLDQWKQAISKRNDLVTQLSSDDVKKLRKENRQSLKSELKAKIKSGELTKKEAIQQFKAHFQQNKDKKQQMVESRKELKTELKAAIQKNDSATIKSILNKDYQHFTDKNNALTQKLEQWKINSTSSDSANSQDSL